MDDLDRVCVRGIDGITIGKVDSRNMMLEAIYKINQVAQGRSLEPPVVLPWIETSKGLVNAADIASCSPQIGGLCFGRDDFLADMAVDRTAVVRVPFGLLPSLVCADVVCERVP